MLTEAREAGRLVRHIKSALAEVRAGVRPPDSQHAPLRAFNDGQDHMTTTRNITTRTARITGPVSYVAASGRRVNIPLGPCVIESMDGPLTDIVWGSRGQSSVALPTEVVQSAQAQGHLVVLD